MKENRTYIAIDLKSFYASVECRERGLDPMKTNLVVADASRTEKTICPAVSPSLKSYGIPGRPRLFEVVQKVKKINAARRRLAPGGSFAGSSWSADELERYPELELGDTTAPPRMAFYMEYSTRIVDIYLKICGYGGYSYLFHRRGVYGCDPLSEILRSYSKRACNENDPGRSAVNRDYGHSRNRHKSLPM